MLWAGPRAKGPVCLTPGVTVDDLKYTMSCGMVPTTPGDPTAFKLDPDIKEEEITYLSNGKKISLLKRESGTVNARDVDGRKVAFPIMLSSGESVLSGLREPHRFPEISALRQEMLSWRYLSSNTIARQIVFIRNRLWHFQQLLWRQAHSLSRLIGCEQTEPENIIK